MLVNKKLLSGSSFRYPKEAKAQISLDNSEREIKWLCHRDRIVIPNSPMLPVLCSQCASREQTGR